MRFSIILLMLAVSNIAMADGLTARIIFAETGPACSSMERLWVASTIKNRINHRGFKLGKLKTMRDVVTQKYAFESLNDPRNSTWVRSENPDKLRGADVSAWRQSVLLSSGTFTPVNDEVVYFHDKSITKPKGWDNKYWTAYKMKETKHFIFYGVRANAR
jgi:hypothetical protein